MTPASDGILILFGPHPGLAAVPPRSHSHRLTDDDMLPDAAK
jgi:hypothetical protein